MSKADQSPSAVEVCPIPDADARFADTDVSYRKLADALLAAADAQLSPAMVERPETSGNNHTKY